MARLGALRTTGFALALLVFTIIQYAATEDKCRSGCQGSSQVFKYAEGTTYKYNLEGNIDVTLSSAEGQQSSTKLKATVLLTQLPQCNQLLRLQNVQVVGPESKKYSNIAGIEKPIRINFHDGHIEDSICTEPGDNQNSLNIKRAVASLFQAALKQQYETDVFGFCPTEIVTRKEGGNLVIQKSRVLNKCAHRESIKQDFMATSFNLNSEIKSSPILNGEYQSEQRIKNGILDHALVTENYLYVPFSVGKNGAKATVSTKIQLAGTSKESPQSKVAEPKTIIFENPHLVNSDKSNVDAILAALKEVKNTIDVTVGERSARSFTNLIKILRVSKKDDILSVYGQVRAGAGFKDKTAARQIFLDALFRAGTGDTIEVGIELLKNKELNPIEQKLVYLGLAFVKHATLASLDAGAALLDQPNLPREAYLGVGTLAGRYCREHPCKNVDALNKLTEKLLQKLSPSATNDRTKENEAISILKAFANMENLNDAVLGKVITIAQDKKTPNRLRAAALETYIADACNDKVRDSAVNILKDIQQDSEIRIKAYLAAAQCPNGKVANALKGILDNEPSYQVGGFIVSHLRNLKASANPDKADAKHQLGQVSTTKKFPIDLRKYSFNNEFSYSVDTLGLASASEANVIYSQNSFLPRSTSLNLTAELFGHTFNFLEIGTRQENFDRLLEHYFGPLGVLQKESVQDLFTTGKASVNKLVDHFTQRLRKTRGKRDVSKADIDNIGKQVQIKTNELNNDLDLDLSVKVFGSELLFLSLNDQTQKYSPDAVIDKIFDELDDCIGKAKNFEKTFQSNMLFIDSEFSYPTSLGFPLRLAVEGSSSLQLKTAGKIDVKALLQNPPQGSPFKLSLIPSANIEIAGTLTVDAQVVESGLKVASTLHTATGGDLQVEFLKNTGIDVKFSLPVENQKLISATHEIVFNSRELGRPETNQPIKFGQNKDFSICMDQLSPFIGLAFCADINNPPATSKHGTYLPFPFSGNAKFSVGIQREDVSQYHYREVRHNEPNKYGAELILETIGAKNEKKLSLQVEAFLAPEPYIKATLVSPIKTASLEGRITNNQQEKSISLQLQHDNQKILGKIGVSVSGGGSKVTYKPLIQYDGPGAQGQRLPVNVEGAITVEQSGDNTKYTFENVKLVSNQKAYTVQGHVGLETAGLYSDITVSDGAQSASLKGKIQVQKKVLKLNAEFKNSISPQVNFNIKYDFKQQPNQVDSNLQLIHGPDLSSKTNKLTLINSYMFNKKTGNDFELKTANKFAYPLLNVDTKFDCEASPKMVDYEFELQYGELKFGSELDLKISKKAPGDYDVEFEVYGLDNKLELKAKREVTGEKSKVDNSLEINGKKLEVTGTVNHHCRPEDVNVGTDLVIKFTGRSEPFKLQSGLVFNPNELDSHLKVSSGSNVYVDIFVKGTKGGNANGSLKVTLKDFLLANGQLRVANGAGNGNVVVDLATLGRKLKLDSTFTVSDPTYNVELTFYTDFEKDNSKKLTLSTKNQIKENSVDSKNFIEVLGKKLEANFKGNLEGKLSDGKLSTEAELTLPTDNYFQWKFNRELHVISGVANGNMFSSLEHRSNKNTPGQKITINGQVKDANFREQLYDISYNIVGENGHGKVLNADVYAKRLPKGDQIAVDAGLKVSGSALPHPLEVTTNAVYKEYVGSYKIQSSYQGSLQITGKYDLNNDDKQLSADFNIDLTTPFKTLRTLKFSAQGKFAEPKEHNYELSGNVGLFVDDDGTNPDATIDAKFSNQAEFGPKKGQIKATAHIQKEDPIGIALGYQLTESGNSKKLDGKVHIEYGKGKVIETQLTIQRPGEHEYNLDFKLDSPEAPNTRLQIDTKRSGDGKTINSEVTLSVKNQKFVLTNELILSDITPGFDVKLVLPNGKVDRITAKLNRISPKQIEAQLKIAFSENNFALDSSLDANVENIDEFFIKITTNSPSLKLDNVVFEAQNKPSKTGKRIQVSAKSAGKNLLSGTTSYKAREEGGKYIVEGSGSFKVQEESKQASFKFISQKLNPTANGEEGLDISFNAQLGSKAIDAELKVTNKQFRILNSYCEEKQQCAHIEVDSKTNVADVGEFNHELEIAVDLRKLGLSHEFGLKGVTTRKNFILDHTVDIYFQNKENKYQYSLYAHPKEAGASLTTPKRIVALEASLQSASQKGESGQIKGEIALYLNKKTQPNKKTALVGAFEYHSSGKGSLASSQTASLKFIDPALGKDLAITYNIKTEPKKFNTELELVFDIFPNANQKIVITGNSHTTKVGTNGFSIVAVLDAKSEGLNINAQAKEELYFNPENREIKYNYALNSNVGSSRYDCGLTFQASTRQVLVLLKALNKQLVKIDAKLQISKEALVANTDVELLGVAPSVNHLELKNFNTFKYTAARRDSPNDKLQIEASFILNQAADFKAEVIKGGAPKKLLYGYVKLDQANLFKSDAAFNSDNIRSFILNAIKDDITSFVKELSALAEKASKDASLQAQQITEQLKKNIPNLKPLREQYQQELQKLREELVSDKTLKELGEFLKSVFGAFAHAFNEVFSRVSEITEKVVATIQQQFARTIELINKEIIPKLTEIAKGLVKGGGIILEKIADVVFLQIAKVTQFIEEHKGELKQIANVFTATGRDIGRLLYKLFVQAEAVITKEWNEFYKGVKSLPIAEELKTKYEQIFKGVEVPEAFVNTLKEAANTLRDAVPFEELKKLITAITEYVEKKLKRQPVDDLAMIQNIVRLSGESANKILKSLSGSKDLQFSDQGLPPLTLQFLNNLPRLVAVKFSPFSYLTRGDFPALVEVLYALSLNPKHWVPPYQLDAIVVQGQHIFTFDGKHITFPGNCNYLLARDAVNGNFSIVGTFTNGLLTAITFADKTDTVTLKKGGQLVVNNAAAEFPVRKPQLDAYRLYESVNIWSKAGVDIVCGPELLVCGIHISGFYHGQLRGLLGNGNSEPYDDYTLPNGKIVTSESDFGNSYKLGNCPPVKTVDHSVHHHNPACNKLFSHESSLSYCYRFVNPENYRTACDHGLAAGVEGTEFAIAVGYVGSCRTKNIPIHVPDQFVKCNNGEQPQNVGDSFSVKTPGKAADVVVIVDQIKSNEAVYKELVQPLITQITTELSSKGITDIDFHLVGYGGDYQLYPSHYTVAGKLTFKGRSPNLKFTEVPPKDEISTGCQYVDKFINILKLIWNEFGLVTGQTLQPRTYAEALKYPFRPHAVKSVIAVVGEPCEKGYLLPLQKLRSLLYKNDQIQLNLVTPFSDFNVKDAKQTKNVIGFNEYNVFTFSDAKKKPEGTSDLHADLEYDDFCVDFTLKNRGNVFVTNNFLQAKGASRKQFTQAAAHNIVDQLLNVEQGLDCECEFVTPYTAQNVCKISYSKDRAVSGGKKGPKGR